MEAALSIEHINENKLTIDPANLRKHPVRNLAAIKASLTRFGWQKPLVIDDNNVVIAGNGSLLAARELGMKKVPCVRSSLIGPDRVAYAIADNRAAELAEWDEPALLDTLQAMEETDVQALGFDASEMSELVDGQADELEDDAPLALSTVAVSKVGDLWHLGEHRLINGDSTKAETYEALLQGELAALCATDPPYLVEYKGNTSGMNQKDWSSIYIEPDSQSAFQFYTDLWNNVLKHTVMNAAFYCWHAHVRAPELMATWTQLDIVLHQIVMWVKPTSLPGRSVWWYKHEPSLMGWRRGHKPTSKPAIESSSVWEPGKPLEQYTHEELVAMLKEASDTWEVDWEGKARVVGNEHPTQKPLEIFARPHRKHTNVGDIVLEPFSGSGSQLIAAEQTQRRCRAIELQPVFVDVAIRRWQRLTGKDATLADGTPWRTVAKKRGVTLDEDGTPIAKDKTGRKAVKA